MLGLVSWMCSNHLWISAACKKTWSLNMATSSLKLFWSIKARKEQQSLLTESSWWQNLIGFIEHSEGSLILRLRSELEIFNVLWDDLPVCDQKTLREHRRRKWGPVHRTVKAKLYLTIMHFRTTQITRTNNINVFMLLKSYWSLTCPSIMYDIIIIWSDSASGNFRGSLVVSISNASTTGSLKKIKNSKTTECRSRTYGVVVMRLKMPKMPIFRGLFHSGVWLRGARGPNVTVSIWWTNHTWMLKLHRSNEGDRGWF